jgi:hypothetical protein
VTVPDKVGHSQAGQHLLLPSSSGSGKAIHVAGNKKGGRFAPLQSLIFMPRQVFNQRPQDL